MPGCHLQENAIKVSKRLTRRPQHPAEVAADVVERVLATGGEMYLQTQQHHLAWWQLSLLDVKAFLLLLVALLLGFVAIALKALFEAVLPFAGRVCASRTFPARYSKHKAA